MDQNTLVEGGDDGIRKVADVFRSEGYDVRASYLVRRLSLAEDEPQWVLVLVIEGYSSAMWRELIDKRIELARAGRLPFIDRDVRLEGVSPDHREASRLLGYLRLFDRPPPMVSQLGLGGLLIDRALIGDDLGHPAKAA